MRQKKKPQKQKHIVRGERNKGRKQKIRKIEKSHFGNRRKTTNGIQAQLRLFVLQLVNQQLNGKQRVLCGSHFTFFFFLLFFFLLLFFVGFFLSFFLLFSLQKKKKKQKKSQQ
jgi:hypothetical protein